MNKLLFSGATLGLISVIMGALSDHSLDLTPDKSESLATAIRYNMIYAVLITALALAPPEKKLHLPGTIFAIGTALFSLSIYTALIFGIKYFTYITPVGGLLIIVGWAYLLGITLRSHKNN